jgi:hypothetical protein
MTEFDVNKEAEKTAGEAEKAAYEAAEEAAKASLRRAMAVWSDDAAHFYTLLISKGLPDDTASRIVANYVSSFMNARYLQRMADGIEKLIEQG